MRHTLHLLILSIALLAAQSCIEDSFTDSPSDQPYFSVETLDFGTVFTDEPTPTRRFLIHNPHSKSLSISDIRLSGNDASCFRLNVDGISGESFQSVDIRGKDSIFVFVAATLPERAGLGDDYEASVDVTTNGVTQSLPIVAHGLNVVRLKALTLTADTRLSAEKPYQIYDSLVVAPGVTLTIEAGATLCFHDKASLRVRGTLLCEGTPEAPISMGGDRTGNVVGDISFDIMSRQWDGVYFADTSTGNRLVNTTIRNTVDGVYVEGNPDADYSTTPQLTLVNSTLTNSGGFGLMAIHSAVKAIGCEFSEASSGLVALHGGTHTFNHCTFANNYLFTAIGGAAVQLSHLSYDDKTGLDDGSGLPFIAAEFTNCILYGLGSEVSHGDLEGTDVYFRRCLLRSAGTDDDNFLMCLWDVDPLYYTVREDYIFDYRLRPDSPAIGAADPLLTLPDAATDAYGLPRGATPDLGAYVFTEPAEEQ
ncbi:MAG: right-handed parallel beta-helix repeat-containing protein [Muribaculaceae bacterium]|nr:right-handed parallel beta-helix repeat-containing protein [Muribaculaceae bacterium]